MEAAPNPNQEKKESFKKGESFLQENIQALQLQNSVTFQNTSNFKYSFQDGAWTYSENRTFEINASIANKEDQENIKILQTQISDSNIDSISKIKIDCSIGVGTKFPEINNVNQVFEEGTANIVHKQGEVILLDIWATWCGPCQKPMAHNQEMLEKNEEKWKDRVRIVAVSVDDSQEDLIQRIEDQGWKRIEHFKLNGWDGEHDAIQLFNVRGIPKVVLIGPDGKIVFSGHPSSTNLQEDINQLLEGKHSSQAKSDATEITSSAAPGTTDDSQSQKQFQETRKILRDSSTLLNKEAFLRLKAITVTLNMKNLQVYQQGQVTQSYGNDDNAFILNVTYKVNKKHQQKIEEFVNHLETTIGKENIQIEKAVQVDPIGDLEENYNWILQTAQLLGWKDLQLEKGIKYEFQVVVDQNSKKILLQKTQSPFIQQVGSLPAELEESQDTFFDHWDTYYNKFCKDDKRDINSIMSILRMGFDFQAQPVDATTSSTTQTPPVENKEVSNFEKISKQSLAFLKNFIKENDGKILDEQVTETILGLPYTPVVSFTVKFSNKYDFENNKIPNGNFSSKPSLQMKIRENDLELFKSFQEKILSLAANANDIENQQDIIQTVNITVGTECAPCKKPLSQDVAHFYCYFTQQHVCVDCANARVEGTEQDTIEHFKYPHNLLFINTLGDDSVLKNLDEYQIGKDIQPKAGEKGSHDHGFACNVGCCSQDPRIYRYVCVSCRPGPMRPGGYVDICDTCFIILQNQKDPKYQKALKNCSDQDHQPNHVLNRILFDNGYLNI